MSVILYYSDPLIYKRLAGHYPMSGLYRARSIAKALRCHPRSNYFLFMGGDLDCYCKPFRDYCKNFAQFRLSCLLCWRAIRFCWHHRSLRSEESMCLVVYNYPINLLCFLPVLQIINVALYLQLEDVTRLSMVDHRRPLHSIRVLLRVIALKLFMLFSQGIIAPYRYPVLARYNKPIFVLPCIEMRDANG